ncbi:MAG TPA: glycine betaine ABC transporter substrate-binding protein [Nitrospiraceae bacterium]|nr:glycine betaine ABC transporter substrate-binding protein [Nitrospiraceae bacterium]
MIAALTGWTAGCDRERPIAVGSKNFTEQVVLGEIVAQHLEHRLGGRVTRKLNLGGTLLAHQALVNGDIDLYPEYTGTALAAVLKRPLVREPVAALNSVRDEYAKRFAIQWLEPLGFNNTFAMVVRGEDARKHRIATLSEAAAHQAGWTLGMGYEFQQREDGLGGLLKTYRLPLKGSPKTMDLGLLYQALEQRHVDMVAGNATDGRLSVADVVVLRDDKQYFPPYDCVLAVRGTLLTSRPDLRQALAELAGRFSDSAMRRLNYQIDGEHRPVPEVAGEFLRSQGLQP